LIQTNGLKSVRRKKNSGSFITNLCNFPLSACLIRKKQQEENMMEDKTSDISSGSELAQENVERLVKFENKKMTQ
jgi:hypothetical protein